MKHVELATADGLLDSIGKIARVTAPVVIVHGLDDRRLPVSAARALFALAVEPKLLLETFGGHNGAGFNDVASLEEALAKFWPVHN